MGRYVLWLAWVCFSVLRTEGKIVINHIDSQQNARTWQWDVHVVSGSFDEFKNVPLIVPTPVDLCSPVTYPQSSSNLSEVRPSMWALLVVGGNCSIGRKTLNLLDVEPTLILLIKGNESEQVFASSSSSFPVISLPENEFLMDIVASPLNISSMDITIDFDSTSNMRVWEVALILVTALLFLSSATTLFVYWYMFRRRFRHLALTAKVSVVPVGVLKLVPVQQYAIDSAEGSEQSICCICLDEFVKDCEIRRLPCKHVYHPGCIDPWLTTRSSLCPICKQDVSEELV